MALLGGCIEWVDVVTRTTVSNATGGALAEGAVCVHDNGDATCSLFGRLPVNADVEFVGEVETFVGDTFEIDVAAVDDAGFRYYVPHVTYEIDGPTFEALFVLTDAACCWD